MLDYTQYMTWRDEPLQGTWHTPARLCAKVDGNGQYVPFAGATTVFRLDRRQTRALALMRDDLTQRLCGTGCLAAPLPESSFHLTLHDLANQENMAGRGVRGCRNSIHTVLRQTMDAVREIRHDSDGEVLCMQTDRIVNMVSLSLVCVMMPVSEKDRRLWDLWYERIQEVFPQEGPCLPHVTLQYYRPGMLDGTEIGHALRDAQPRSPIVLRLPVESLTAQFFSSMQTYRDWPLRVCFICDGGLNRSVMASAIANHMAAQRGLPLVACARSAEETGKGSVIPEDVIRTLSAHGIGWEAIQPFSVPLSSDPWTAFSRFVAVTAGAYARMLMAPVEKARWEAESGWLLGIPDPAEDGRYEEAYARLEKGVKALIARWTEEGLFSTDMDKTS